MSGIRAKERVKRAKVKRGKAKVRAGGITVSQLVKQLGRA